MTREEELDIRQELRITKKVVEEYKEENKMLLDFIKSFASDFEGDYVMADGRIVDNPTFLLKHNYEKAKEVINKAEM